MWKNTRKFASEEENPVKTQGCSSWYSGAKMWQSVGNIASEEGKSCSRAKNVGKRRQSRIIRGNIL